MLSSFLVNDVVGMWLPGSNMTGASLLGLDINDSRAVGDT